MKFVALLRGVNVSGKNIIKMESLRKAMSRLPVSNVSTYIQSGNILFEAEAALAPSVSTMISDLIASEFSLDITVIIKTPDELSDAIENNPFSEITQQDSVQPYIGFLSDIPDKEKIGALQAKDFQKDVFEIRGQLIYVWYADSAGNTKLSNAVIERTLGLKATFRNQKTVRKLIGLSA